MSQCPYQNRLSAYHDRELDAPAAAELAGHLATCPRCAQELHAIEEMGQLISSAPMGRMSQIAMARLHGVADRSASRGGLLPLVRGLIAVAASILIIGGAWLMEMPAQRAGVSHPSVSINPSTGAGEWWESVASGDGAARPPTAAPTGMAEVDDSQGRFQKWMIRSLDEEAGK